MKQNIGFEINLPEGSKLVTIPASPDLKKYFEEELFPKKKSYLLFKGVSYY